VPLVRVNDVLIPDTSVLNQSQSRLRPQSPPPHPYRSPLLRNPLVRGNDIPDSSVFNQSQYRQRPQSPPSHPNRSPLLRNPLVRVNDVLIPDGPVFTLSQSRQSPQLPPSHPHPSPLLRNRFIQQVQSPLQYLGDSWQYPVFPGEVPWRGGRQHFLHPRYLAPNLFIEDEEEPLNRPPLENINIIRGDD
jgi:hypothetical protein